MALPTASVYRNEKNLKINGLSFTLIEENKKDALNIEALEERYYELFDIYDYVVGDWSYDQLRLRGFYENDQRYARLNQRIDFLDEYLYEYCAFGCAYFVLKRERTPEEEKEQQQAIVEMYRGLQEQHTKKKNKHNRNTKHRNKRKENREYKETKKQKKKVFSIQKSKKSKPANETKKTYKRISGKHKFKITGGTKS